MVVTIEINNRSMLIALILWKIKYMNICFSLWRLQGLMSSINVSNSGYNYFLYLVLKRK